MRADAPEPRDPQHARRLRQLEDENSRLKHLLAEERLDNHGLKAALGKA